MNTTQEISKLQHEIRCLQCRINTLVEEGGSTDFSTLSSYASNTDALVDLEVGQLYKSTTLINGSPIILITQ